jgi:hypothetical protein
VKLVYFNPPKGCPGQRWRYLVHHGLCLPSQGGWYFTNRMDAADHARRCEMSSGQMYRLVDRSKTAGRAAPQDKETRDA